MGKNRIMNPLIGSQTDTFASPIRKKFVISRSCCNLRGLGSSGIPIRNQEVLKINT